MLTRLSEQGVRIAIDDFGTGYSSLGRLKHLPVHQLKVDMSFVQGMAGDARDRAIVRSVVDLAHSLGLEVVAEGIEDRETWEALSAMGCDLAQGYLISKPLRVDEMDRWLHALPARGNGTAQG